MTTSVPSRVGANPFLGIGLKIASVALFVGMMICIKAAGSLPPGEIVFFRSLFAVFPILVFLAFQGELSLALSTTRPLGHVLRGLVGVTAMALGFIGLILLPLPEAITIGYAKPLFVIAFSALFLGETVRIFRWSAVVAGLVGVMIISWPKLTVLTGETDAGTAEALGVGAVLLSAMLAAIAMLLVRRLINTERTSTIVLWFSLTATVLSLLTLPFGWEWLDTGQAALLIGAGMFGGVAQLFLTEAYRHAEVSSIAPFEYTSMVLGIAAGYLFFADIPTVETLAGGAIVVASGLFIIWREHRLGIRRRPARSAVTPQG